VSGTEPVDLSSCVLCGRPLDDETETGTYGGTTVDVHPSCADAGLEGMDLASPHADPDADGSAGSREVEGASDGGRAPDGTSGVDGGTDADGDPEWTRISDFT
jgi:hypothetical protein